MLPLVVTLLLVPRPVLSGVEETLDAGARVRVHYTITGVDALVHGARDEAPKNGVPDDADAVGRGAAGILDRWSGPGRMRPPLGDGGAGGDDRIDIYVRLLDGVRGYAHPEEVGMAPATSAWLEVDPRPAGRSLERLSAAAGHEALHAIQFAYSAGVEPWVREATATWVEDRDFDLADEITEHRRALLAAPSVPLTTIDGQHEYDAMVFLDFLAARGFGAAPDLGIADPAAGLHTLWLAMRDRGATAGIEQVTGLAGAPLMYEWARYLLSRADAPVSARYLGAGVPHDLPLPPWSLQILAPERLPPCQPGSTLLALDGSVTFGAPPLEGQTPAAGTSTTDWSALPAGRYAVLARGEAGPTPTVRVTLQSGVSQCTDLGAPASDGDPADLPMPPGCSCAITSRSRAPHSPAPLVLVLVLALALRLAQSRLRATMHSS